MTSRERVLCALSHREPDRMPIDLGMHTSTGISAFAYDALRKYLGVPQEEMIVVRDYVQCTALVEEAVLERLHCDCMALLPMGAYTRTWSPRPGYTFRVPAAFTPEQNAAGDWVLTHNGKSMRMPSGGYFFDGDWIVLEDRWGDENLRAVGAEAERIYKETEYFTALTGVSPLFEQSMDFFCAMITEPEAVEASCKRGLASWKEICGRIIDRCGGHVQMLCMSGDLGGQHAPLVNPAMFAEQIAPYLQKLCAFIHEHSDYKIFLHSCGAVEPFIETFIECGIDVLNPVQITAAGMAPLHLKQAYGDRIAFWGGGVDTQGVLGQKGPEAVRENVRENVGAFKPGGGYVFNSVHNIVGNVPPENIVAAYDEAYRLAGY